jgi:hypothetical protein
MANPYNSPRGLVSSSLAVPASKGVRFHDYSATANLLTANSTGLISAGAVRVSNAAGAVLTGNSTGLLVAGGIRLNALSYVRANSTGYSFTAVAAKSAVRTAAYNWQFITNSTGQSAIAVRTTGTTWKFLNVTTLIPT